MLKRRKALASAVDQPWFALYADAVNRLAESSFVDRKNTAVELATLLESAPTDLRPAISAHFKAARRECKRARRREPRLSRREKAVLAAIERSEDPRLSQWLGETTLHRIRRLFLSDPALRRELADLGRTLEQRGIGVTKDGQIALQSRSDDGPNPEDQSPAS